MGGRMGGMVEEDKGVQGKVGNVVGSLGTYLYIIQNTPFCQ
jgi:hypothetical protein